MSTNNDHIALSKPPQDCLYPLHVLNRYLASLEKEQNANDEEGRPSAFSSTKRQDELLQTVDFLYGSALDGALAVLESSPSSSSSSDSGSITCTSHNVTRLQSPHRSLYTVSSSAKSTALRGGRAGPSSWSQAQDSCYLCMIPEYNNNSNSDSNEDGDSAEIYYCSCRSFLEKSRNSGSSGVVSLCKHLLALKLMPVLGLTCTTAQLATEEEFSRALLQRVSP